MKKYTTPLLALTLAACVSSVSAIPILYTAEGDTTLGGVATDSATAGGLSNGAFTAASGVSVSSTAAFGASAFEFNALPGVQDVITLPGTASLGIAFSLSVNVDPNEDFLSSRRLFTSFDGAGGLVDELIIDLNPNGSAVPFRLLIGPLGLSASTSASLLPGYNNITATYDDGAVFLYLNGVDVGSGTLGSGAITLTRDLQFGEDTFGEQDNEQFVGLADDIFVWNEALTPAQVLDIAENGAAQFVIPEPSSMALIAVVAGFLGFRRTRRLTRRS